jgi:CDP-paratose 2-epimerase
MNILITGGAGFIGSHAAEFFASRDHNLILIDNFSRSKLLNKNIPCNQNWLRIKKNYPNIKLFEFDLRNSNDLDKVLMEHEIDTILHAAGQTAVTSSIKNPMEDFENNVKVTLNVLESARKYKEDAIILYCSTNKVYGDKPNTLDIIEEKKRYSYKDPDFLGIKENFDIDSSIHTPYGASKLAGDIYVQEYSNTYGLKTGIFRMSCIYGENQQATEDQGWLVFLINKAIQERRVNIFGDGKQVRDVLYVGDLVELFNQFIDKYDSVGSQIFCIGGGRNNTISILELLDILEAGLGKKIGRDFFPRRKGDQKIYVSDIAKAGEILDWKPKIGVTTGIEKIIEHVKTSIKANGKG